MLVLKAVAHPLLALVSFLVWVPCERPYNSFSRDPLHHGSPIPATVIDCAPWNNEPNENHLAQSNLKVRERQLKGKPEAPRVEKDF